MLWFKYKNKTAEKKDIKETKALKKADKIAKKDAILLQKKLQKNTQTPDIATPESVENEQSIELNHYTLQLYQEPNKFNFVPITLFIEDCLNSYCLQKLLTILQNLPKHSEVFFNSCYLVDRLQYEFPDLIFHELSNFNKLPAISGHFVASIQLTTIDVQFLLNTITQIFQHSYEVYLFYYNKPSNLLTNYLDNFLSKFSVKLSKNKQKTDSSVRQNLFDVKDNTKQITDIMHTFISTPYFCMDKLFLIYTKTIANEILQINNNLSLQCKSNFLPLLLSNNICFLDSLPTKHYSYTTPKILEADIKEYLKIYKILKAKIHNDQQYILFYKVIEDKLLQYYAHLILNNRLDKLEKFDSSIQKNYFVFYIGLAEHSPSHFIQKLRKKHYKANMFIKYLAKKILFTAKKASK